MEKKIILLLIAFILLLCLGGGYWYFNIYKSSKAEAVSESKAIEMLKNRFPELNEYPSDKLPIKSIKTEKADEGWYVSFIQEGSGVAIIDARCYWVKNSKSIMVKDYTPQKDNYTGEFSVRDCTLAQTSK